ncbi:MAG: hypothetical protein GY877_08555 [Hyphomicrobium sp.]|nr:hypothetical protein [Hyphomicrobium sp.]
MRLFAAAGVFWLVGAVLGSIELLQMMAGCVIVALLAIPLRIVIVLVEIADFLAGGWLLGTPQP